MNARARIDLRALMTAMADASSPDAVLYIDSQTGEIIKIMRTTPTAELVRFKTRMDRERDRLVMVPRPTAEETYGDMEAFLATVKDKKLHERLRIASSSGGTLRDFLDVLTPAPLEKDRWYRFREARMGARLQAWMRASGLGA